MLKLEALGFSGFRGFHVQIIVSMGCWAHKELKNGLHRFDLRMEVKVQVMENGVLLVLFHQLLPSIRFAVCSRFKGLRVGYFELRYALNENPNCVLDYDANILNMFMVLNIGKSIVEILVMDKCDDSMVQLPTESTASCRTSDSMIVASENDHLRKYGSHGVHNFMSCEWNSYIESEGQVFRGGCVDFRDKLKKFSVECGFELKTVFELNSDDVDAYKFLPWYVESACSSNHGSVVELKVVPESNRLFIAYDAWIECLMFCPSILFIDEIFEVAYAIVDSETIANWRWFFAILFGILRPQGGVITFMSDKHDGILKSIREFFPECPHSFCIVHLKQNVSTLFLKATGERLKKKMMNLLANCAYACTPSDFDDCMVEFKDNEQGHVKNFLCDLPKENYAITNFLGKRWGLMSNAFSESFNVMVSNSRCMPLLDILKDIRVRLMGSMAEKRILVLQQDNCDVFYYVDDYWKTSFYQKTYQFVMHPFSDLEKPNVDTIINGVRPPITKILSRRPKKTRIKSAGEISGSSRKNKQSELIYSN
ncbi:unnamed protein product [Malus baccata var. baccata]